MTWDTKILGAMTIFVVVVVVAVVGYDVYVHQALLGPKEVGIAEIVIAGRGHFRGDFGTERDTFSVEGEAPATIGVHFARSDYVMAGLQESPGSVKIVVGKDTLDKGSSAVGWRVPHDY